MKLKYYKTLETGQNFNSKEKLSNFSFNFISGPGLTMGLWPSLASQRNSLRSSASRVSCSALVGAEVWLRLYCALRCLLRTCCATCTLSTRLGSREQGDITWHSRATHAQSRTSATDRWTYRRKQQFDSRTQTREVRIS